MHVCKPSGTAQIAGAERIWLVKSVTFRGLLSVVSSEDAVPRTLSLVSIDAFAIADVVTHLGVSCWSVYTCKDRSNVPSRRSAGIMGVTNTTKVIHGVLIASTRWNSIADSRREVERTADQTSARTHVRDALGCTFPASSIPRFSCRDEDDINHGVSLTTPSIVNHQNRTCSRSTVLHVTQCQSVMRKSAR